MARVLILAGLLLSLLALGSGAQSVTQLVMSCPFSTHASTLYFNTTYYFENQPNCSSLTTQLQLPDGTVHSLNESACSGGVHQYNFSADSRGVYTITTAGAAASTGTCSIARLAQPSSVQSFPDLPAWLAPPLALLALFFLRRGR